MIIVDVHLKLTDVNFLIYTEGYYSGIIPRKVFNFEQKKNNALGVQ